MPHRSSYAEGTPSWVDLSTPDPEASKAFYAGLFGWSWEDQHQEGQYIYSIASLDGAQVAGLGPQPEEMTRQGMPPLWNTYLAADSCDGCTQRAVDAGGKTIVEPMDVMDAGRMAFIADTQGAVFGLWEAGTHRGAEKVTEPGAFTWAELYVPDTEAAARFYEATVGLGAEAADMGEMPYTTWKVGDAVVGGTMPPPMPGIPNHWHVYFGASDTAGLVARARELGATVLVEPMDTPVGAMATIQDPQGGAFSVIQLNEWPTG